MNLIAFFLSPFVFLTATQFNTVIESILPAVHRVYVERNIIEDSEEVFTKPYNFYYDCGRVQYRIEHITDKTPPLEALYSLPNLTNEEYYSMCDFQDAFAAYIDSLYRWSNDTDRSRLEDLQVELNMRKELWASIMNLRTKPYTYNYEGRRLALEELIKKIGKDNFYSGNIPSCIPEVALKSTWYLDYKKRN